MLLPLLLSLTFLEPAEARVPPALVGLQWSAPPGCPARAEVIAELEALTNGAVEVQPGAPTTLDATVAVSETGFRMQLRIERRGVVETQSLDAKTCETLARAVVLVAGVDLSHEPETVVAPTDGPPEPASASPPPSATEASETPPAREAPPRALARPETPPTPATVTSQARRVRVVAFAGAGPSLGYVPSPTARLDVAIGIRTPRWQFDATGFHNFAASATVVETASLSGSLSGGGLRGCWVPTVSRLEFPTCAGLALGSLRTEPSASVQSPQIHRDLWAGGTLSAGLAWVIRDRIALLLQVQGAVSLRRPGVHWNVDATRRLAFRVAPVTGALVVGPQVRLP